MTEEVDEIPDSAMLAHEGDNHENYVVFPVTDVIEWFTKKADGTITKEQFISTNPEHLEDAEDYLWGEL